MINRNDPTRYGEALRESLLRFIVITVPARSSACAAQRLFPDPLIFSSALG